MSLLSLRQLVVPCIHHFIVIISKAQILGWQKTVVAHSKRPNVTFLDRLKILNKIRGQWLSFGRRFFVRIAGLSRDIIILMLLNNFLNLCTNEAFDLIGVLLPQLVIHI
jgi:hypothetical protein